VDDIDDARAWWGVGLAVAAVGWGAQQFAPLLLMYQDELDLTTTTIQAVFGLYVLGLIPGLLLGGPVSDRYGRRRVMAPTLAASVVATVLLMLGGTGIGWLFAGRLVAGVASGAAFSSGAAWIKELSGATASGARRVTVAMTAGFGLGPLVAGVLAQWAPAPTVLPYVPHLVLAAVAFGPALRASETPPSGRAYRSAAAISHPGDPRAPIPRSGCAARAVGVRVGRGRPGLPARAGQDSPRRTCRRVQRARHAAHGGRRNPGAAAGPPGG
jgi:MFS family permease